MTTKEVKVNQGHHHHHHRPKLRTGDLVWARMKGFSWWPSRITEPNPEIKPPAAAKHKPHHFCFFFGSENYAWVEEEKMAEYDGNREKLKPAKISTNLQIAIDRIEEALVDWKLKRALETPGSPMFEMDDDDASPTLSTHLLGHHPDFDFHDEDSTDIFSSNIMSNKNESGPTSGESSPFMARRSEDEEEMNGVMTSGDSTSGFGASKRKASPADNGRSSSPIDAKEGESIPSSDSEGKAKRARKAPSKFADFAVGELGDSIKLHPPIRTFSRKSSITPATTATASSATTENGPITKTLVSDAPSSMPDATPLEHSSSNKTVNNNNNHSNVNDNITITSTNASSSTKVSTKVSKKQDSSSSSPSKVPKVPKKSAAASCSSSSLSSPSKSRVAPSPLRFGFLGLGVMGSAMASSLLKSGHDVMVWNRTATKSREMVKAGASKASSAAEVVAACDVTFSCVSDPAALKELVFGNSGALQGISDGKGYVDMSTVDVETCLEVAEAVQSRGGKFLEAPVCGSKEPAKRGLLTILAAGDKELYDECESCFSAMGKRAFYLGDIGNASKMKCVINLLDGIMMAGMAEAMALTEQVGLRHQDVMEVLELGNLDCELLREKGREMIEGTFTPSIALKHQQKDLKLAVHLADEHHLPLITGAAANELFKRARAMGYDEHDNSAVYRAAQYNS